MSRNYYDLLGLTMDARMEDVQKAFRKMAIKYHPELNKGSNQVGRTDCERKFRMVAEAYDVLSNPKLRAIFDQYGEDGLKEGGTGDVGVPGGYCFTEDPDKVFKNFFGVANPFEKVGANVKDLIKDEAPGLIRERPQCATKKLTVACTLEEMFSGARKELTVTNTHLGDGTGKSTKQESVSWRMEPGMQSGTKLRFEKKGTTRIGHTPGDLLIELQQAPHPSFSRQGHDLVHTKKISLDDALCGFNIDVVTLDLRRLQFFINDVVHPKYVKCVAGEGMPVPGGNGERGDLLLRFDIEYPPYLTEGQKRELSRVLGGENAQASA